jgi:hypothetical protein
MHKDTLCVSMLCGLREVYGQDVEVTMIDHPGMHEHWQYEQA